MAAETLAAISEQKRIALRNRISKARNHLEKLEPLANNETPSEADKLATSYLNIGLSYIDLSARMKSGQITTVRCHIFNALRTAIKQGKLDWRYSSADLQRCVQTIDKALQGDGEAERAIWAFLERGHVRRAAGVL